MLSDEARKRLLSIARASVLAAVRGERPPVIIEPHPELQGHHGCFVTLKNHGRLRGCIGCFASDRPLWQTVQQQAISSATQDPRFTMDPIRPAEVAELDIEISVLSPPRKIENPLDIQLGRHGIIVQSGSRRGCFLPQVATETGWSKEEFLSHCAAGKAGLAPDAWRQPGTVVYTFEAEVFGEREQKA